MNWETLTLVERLNALDGIKERLNAQSAAERLDALKSLAGCRLEDAVRLAIRLSGDSDAEVRTLAKGLRLALQRDLDWFGQGEHLRIELPPALPTLAEEARTTRFMWALWTLGGFLTVTTMLIREHTGALMLPLFGTFVLTLGLLFFTRKLALNKPSPGSLYLDLRTSEAHLELLPPDAPPTRKSAPLQDIQKLKLERVVRERHPDDPPETLWIASLAGAALPETVILRGASREDLLPILKRLTELTPWQLS